VSGPLRIVPVPPGFDWGGPEGRAMRSPERRRGIGLCSCERPPLGGDPTIWAGMTGRDPDCPIHNDQHEHAFWKQFDWPSEEKWCCPCGKSYWVKH
jgi:hypothetical protein